MPEPVAAPVAAPASSEPVAAPVVDVKAPVDGAPLTPAEKQKLKFKAKFYDKEEEVELDEDTIRRDYQKWKAADHIFQQSSQQRKQAEEFISKMKDRDGLVEVLGKLGYDPRQLAEDFLYDTLKLETMSPEQKRIAELEQWKRIKEKEEKEKAAQSDAQKNKEAVDRIAKGYQEKIISALESSGLPKTPSTVWRMARQMEIHVKQGVDLEPGEVVDLVRAEIIKEHQELYPSLEGEALMRILGDDIGNKIRKYDLAKIKTPHDGGKSPKEPVKNMFRPKKTTYISEKDFESHLEKMKALPK